LARVLVIALVGTWSCGAGNGDLAPAEAASALRASPGFAIRQGSMVGRQLVDALSVRRIGRTSSEVAFTWLDTPRPSGQSSPVRTSMALFRRLDDGAWVLASLYKVD